MEIFISIIFLILLALLYFGNKLRKEIERMRNKLVAFESTVEDEEMVRALTRIYVLEHNLNDARQSLHLLAKMIKQKQDGKIDDTEFSKAVNELAAQGRKALNTDVDEAPLEKRAKYELHHQRTKMVESNRKLRQRAEAQD